MKKIIRHDDKRFRHVNLPAIWHAREILFHLMKRDIMVTYKQTLLGVGWVVIQPVAMALSIIFVFDHIGSFPDYGVPYILIALSALVCWEFFSGSVAKGTTCLIDDADILVRSNFPRIIFLLNAALKNALGPIINLGVLFGFMVFFNIPFTWNLVLLPFVLALLVLLNLALGLWLGTLNVFKRDIGTFVPYLLRLALFTSPVAFTINSVPEDWQLLYSLNPLVAIIETMRFCILGEAFRPDLNCMIVGACSLALLLLSGIYIFGSNERKFADII